MEQDFDRYRLAICTMTRFLNFVKIFELVLGFIATTTTITISTGFDGL